jgi:hypothetical protein
MVSVSSNQRSQRHSLPNIASNKGFAVTVDDAMCDPNLLKPNQRANAFGTITHKPH